MRRYYVMMEDGTEIKLDADNFAQLLDHLRAFGFELDDIRSIRRLYLLANAG